MTTLECGSVTQLLSIAFARKKEKNKGKYSFADVARAGGFSSRGYVRDVILGHKRLTEKRLEEFSKILELTVREKKLLTALIRREAKIPGSDTEVTKLQTSFARSVRRKTVLDLEAGAITPNTLHVYAGIANEANSRDLKEVVNAKGLNDLACRQEIDRMLKLGSQIRI